MVVLLSALTLGIVVQARHAPHSLTALAGKTKEYLDEPEPNQSGLGENEIVRRLSVHNDTMRKNLAQIR